MFNGRALLIATKHQKDQVISPVFEKELGVNCFVNPNFDTDELGTFTGEIERKADALTTVKNKCLLGLKLTQGDLAIASEGSFGPHPSIFIAHANEELLFFIDKKNNLEITARELSLETNFSGSEINSEKKLKEFAHHAKFPDHGLIIRQSQNDYINIKKGITDWETLLKEFYFFSKKNESVYVETDMRAMFNPTRMKVIEKVTHKLVAKIKSCCPQCNTPGFSITDVKGGLPCVLCASPTRSTLSYIYTCQKCNFNKEEKYPHGKFKEEPMYCDSCNP